MYFLFFRKKESTEEKTRGCAFLLCTVPAKAGAVIAAKSQCHILELMLGSSNSFSFSSEMECAVGTAKQLWENQAEEVGLREGRGIQNFAEVEASGNEVGQKDGPQSFGEAYA